MAARTLRYAVQIVRTTPQTGTQWSSLSSDANEFSELYMFHFLYTERRIACESCFYAPPRFATAASAGVSPHLLRIDGSALCAFNMLTMSLLPLYSAMCNAVQPSLS